MRRFTLQPDQLTGSRVTFDANESRHLSRVLRLRPGDTVIASDGAGRDYTVRLETVGEAAWGRVIAQAAGVPESPLAIPPPPRPPPHRGGGHPVPTRPVRADDRSPGAGALARPSAALAAGGPRGGQAVRPGCRPRGRGAAAVRQVPRHGHGSCP